MNEDARKFSAFSGLSGGCSLEGLSLVACVSPLPRLQPEAKARACGGGGVGEGAGGSCVGEGPSLCGTCGPENSQVYVFPKLTWKRPTREELNAVWHSLRWSPLSCRWLWPPLCMGLCPWAALAALNLPTLPLIPSGNPVFIHTPTNLAVCDTWDQLCHLHW